MEITEVSVPIFLHPHLFWVFQLKKSLVRNALARSLADEYENSIEDKEENFGIGELVAIKRDGIWRRAIIEDVIEDGSLNYEVWLMDYGCLHHTNRAFKLVQKFKSQPALVEQASLHDVVFIDEALSLENRCVSKNKNSKPNAGATVNALKFLKDYTLFFSKKKEMNGIFFGDLLYKRDGTTSSLTETLIEKALMVHDEELFSKVEESRIYDKEFHILALRQASKNQSDVGCNMDLSNFMDTVFTRSNSRGLSLYGCCSETDHEHREKPLVSKYDILMKLRRKFCTTVKLGNSCSESENEEVINEIDNKSVEEGHVTQTSQENLSNSSNQDDRKEESLNHLNHASKSRANINKLVLLRRKTSKAITDVEDHFFSSDGESLTTSLCEPNANDDKRSLNAIKAQKVLKLTNTTVLPSGWRSVNSKSRKDTSYFSDSSVSFSAKLKGSTNIKIECNISTNSIEKGTNSSQEGDDEKVTDGMPNSKDFETPGESVAPKPVCNCRQCRHWTSSEDWGKTAENFQEEYVTTHLNITRPLPLTLKGTRGDNIKLSSIRYRNMSKLEKQSSFKLLVHGCLLPIPMERISESSFHPVVHQCLKNMGYTRALKTQTYIWPAVTRHMNICLINRERSGKTMAYLPALCSFLLEKEERYFNFKKGGPIVTVLCPNSTKCEELYDLINKLLVGAGTKKPKVVLVTYPFEHINMSSIDLLVTIPTVLVEILRRNMTNMKRLCHLVLEDVDVLLNHFNDEVEVISKLIDSMLAHRTSKQTVQVIAIGEHWTLKVEKFIKKLMEVPIICIGDLLESSLYGRIKLKVKCINTDGKRDYVIDILKNKWSFLKTVVLCNTDEEVEELKTSLILAGISTIAITSNLPKEDILQQEANWEHSTGGSYRVLICTDQIMQTMLSITSAGILVHFSLPEKWTMLKKRFSCLLENCKSPLLEDDNKMVCESYLLTDGICEEHICKLVSVLKDYNLSSDQYEKFLMVGEAYQKKREAGRLCSSFKKFGLCQLKNCSDRHHLDYNLDSSSPENGRIKFKILEILDVNHYKVHLMGCSDVGENQFNNSSFDSDDIELTSLLKLNRRTPEIIQEGKTYAFWDADHFDDVFRECIVQEVRSRDISILIRNTGKRMNVGHNQIFLLPEEFDREMRDSSIAELIVANVKPPFKDGVFSARAFIKLKGFIERIKYDDKVFVGNICLQLQNLIYVDQITEEINVFEMNVSKCDLIKELFHQKIADRNPDHMKILYKHCDSANINLPNYKISVKRPEINIPSQATPQWAFLEMDKTNNVFFSGAIAPDEFYVRLEKFDSLLLNLQNDISDAITRQGSGRDIDIVCGYFYLARDVVDNKFNRVLVKQIEKDKVLCFAVDYGDETIVKLENIRFLPNYLIQKLPFQAIQCSLHGIKAVSGDWPTNSIDVFYNKLCFEPDSDVFRTLFAKCIYYEKASYSKQLKYSILLKDNYENSITVNQLLVDCGWAVLDDIAQLEDFYVEHETLEEEEDIDEDVEEIQDIIEKTTKVTSNSVVIRENSGSEVTESINDNPYAELDCFFGEPEEEMDQFIDFMSAMVALGQEKKNKLQVTQSLPPIEVAPFEVDYHTPDVYWSQDAKSVQMIIKLPNVEIYKVKIEKYRIFIFQTTLNDKRYELNLMLYGTVEKTFNNSPGGLEIKIKLTKREPGEWPKLTRNKRRLRNVHYMMGEEELKEDEKKLFLDLGDELRNFEYCGDGALLTVMSDLDSDFDSELEEDSDS